ncbi:class I SAM-dependent methyltransferase [Photobacterium toruni]|uniref:Ribosomal RNA adenine dimethylase n=1 Tax=Photobacterium toruni TaxID=1935446 RepID=A0A1T4PW09_9GAMM|nr:rRNA adenine N-6-methyltransferase family protein [Photobacterium toruni]MEC6815023.1 rRNA adenine N-6-methyltransferase family protein [Photobacterium toruni]MEC6831027.1 rRNA adenine N-6-methyltransferase family protein [Photobacterium toruni]SJZ95754.1 Ribosomal RNA adenine dimethylase [Photobacterium toruni]
MIIEFLRNPKNTGSVISSSQFLVQEMISHISPENTIIELGAGSGVITRKLAEIQAIDTIYTYENNPIFHKSLVKIDKTICVSDLFTMKQRHKNQKVKTVISSIPFVNFSTETKTKALNDISTVLDHGGKLIQYTYLNRCPFGKDNLHQNKLMLTATKKVWLNFPPATVFVYEKNDNL